MKHATEILALGFGGAWFAFLTFGAYDLAAALGGAA